MRKTSAILLLLLPALVGAQDEYLIDWDAVGDEAIGYMVDLVRIDSSNPPGNETQVANYIRNVLAGEGIASEMYALDPERANLVARIKGNGKKRPILIMGHTDVVGVQAGQWSEDPFGGVRNDGYIWGRGTLDDKDNVTAGIIVMLLLKRLGVELDRDIIFLAESGEEGTQSYGIGPARRGASKRPTAVSARTRTTNASPRRRCRTWCASSGTSWWRSARRNRSFPHRSRPNLARSCRAALIGCDQTLSVPLQEPALQATKPGTVLSLDLDRLRPNFVGALVGACIAGDQGNSGYCHCTSVFLGIIGASVRRPIRHECHSRFIDLCRHCIAACRLRR